MTNRYRANFYSGVVSGIVSTSQLTITGTGFPNLTIPANQYMAITLAPGYYGTTIAPEIVYIGPGTTSTVAQVVQRGAEGSIAITGTNIPWVAGPTPTDFDVSNLTATGTLSLSGTGGIAVSGTANFTNFTIANNAVATFSGVTISGIPKGRMYASSGTLVPSGSVGTAVGTTVTGTYGFTTGGVTLAAFSGSSTKLVVPTAGYYQINASVGLSASGGSNPIVAGVYGLQIGVYSNANISGGATNTGYYIGANNYIAASGTPGIYPETIVFSDILYLGANYGLNLVVTSASGSNYVIAGSVNGPQTTYLSLSYIGS